MITNKKAVTLIEISIGAIISALLLIGLLNLLNVGMRGSTKGLTHQANMESASILMAQIEYDLLRATEIMDPPSNGKDSSARWKFYYSHSKTGPAIVNYSLGPNGVTRNVDLGGGKSENTVFCNGHKVDLAFTSFAVETGFEQYRHGMCVELTVSAKEKKTGDKESFSLKRLIMVRSQM